ncbi:flagellar protein FlgJ [Photobacterium aphoticum]|uniref:Flagellar protein FlgJ n=1 Tax=Photobacterium aphoticum TaxID=754436 RepID=A0A090QX68_9GAMM|nr:flagellar protein FlgJ [Photobacterium aphoticum]
MKTTSPGFIHDMANLDRLRAGIGDDQGESLKAAAEQFEAIFTQMLFKSMRQANEAFESDLISSSNSKFFEQMHDEQMASELSTTGSLGLADLIVEQLGGGISSDHAKASTDADKTADSALASKRLGDEFEIRPITQPAPSAKSAHASDETSPMPMKDFSAVFAAATSSRSPANSSLSADSVNGIKKPPSRCLIPRVISWPA